MKVTEKNDWELRTYHVGDVQLDPETHTSLWIKFPDGTLSERKVKWHEETHSYSDHGHRHTVKSRVPYIQVGVCGVNCGIKLTFVEVIL